MKSEFLKIAGVKSDKAFYKKYPTEAAFFKAHPEAKKQIKKAQFGDFFSSFSQNMQNVPDMQSMIQSQTQSGGVNASMFPANDYNKMYMGMSTADEQLKQPTDYNKEYMNMSLADEQLKQPGQAKPSFIDQISKYAGPAGQILGGIQAIKAGKKKKEDAERMATLTGLQAQAAESEDVDDLRQYTENAEKKRRAFMPEMTGEEFFPVYGVGTNVLARNGARLEDGGMVGGNILEKDHPQKSSTQFKMPSMGNYSTANSNGNYLKTFSDNRIGKSKTNSKNDPSKSNWKSSYSENINNMITNRSEANKTRTGSEFNTQKMQRLMPKLVNNSISLVKNDPNIAYNFQNRNINISSNIKPNKYIPEPPSNNGGKMITLPPIKSQSTGSGGGQTIASNDRSVPEFTAYRMSAHRKNNIEIYGIAGVT
jgi:hypothetical protein